MKLRSYNGAPPVVPHPVPEHIAPASCLTCHKEGGYVEKYQAPAPITPHPDWVSCSQCHVPKQTNESFKESHFKKWLNKDHPPKKTTVTAPPVIPHSDVNRQNCMSCHDTQASIKQTTHPYRQNCTQCHVFQGFKATQSLKVPHD